MTQPKEDRRPGEKAAIQVVRGDEATLMVTDTADAERQRRRLHLHHVLVKMPRWSAELDELLTELDDEFDDGFAHVDYHRDHLDLTWAEREAVGRELAAAGWSA